MSQLFLLKYRLPHAFLAAALAGACLNAAAQDIAVIDTDQGKIEIALDAAHAPATVANFKTYAAQGFYNNTVFHRVIPGFMIQGGGFTAQMVEKPTAAPIRNEAGNGLKNDKYTIAMARTTEPNSATAQFFINVANNRFLNHRDNTPQGFGYAVFGKVVRGQEVVDKIAAVPTRTLGRYENVPVAPVVIRNIRITASH